MRSKFKTLIFLALALALVLPAFAQSVKFSVSPAKLKPGEKGVLKATLTIADPEKKQNYDPAYGEDDYFNLVPDGNYPNLKFGKTQYPAPTQKTEGIWEYHKSVTLSKPFTLDKNAKPGKVDLKATMTYGLCHKTSGFCDPPKDVSGKAILEILAVETVAETQAEDPDQAVDNQTVAEPQEDAETEEIPAETEPETGTDKPVGGKIWYYLLLALLGGIVLNFTPCVLPILPIRAMSMVNQAQKDITKVLIHTMVYTLGVLLSFGAIASVFVIARASGVNLTYGFLSQSLIYNLIMLSILFLFGLSLMGVWEMTAPGMNVAAKSTSKQGYAGSFFAGIFAFLMGFSCMGPFMGPALEVAVRLSSPMLVLFFLLIGFGFALPFIIISLFPKALKLIPKPGEWMNIFKETMGFVLMYLVWKYFSNVWGLTKSGPYMINTAMFIVFLGFGAWLYGRFVRPENKKWVQIVLGLAAVAVIAWAAWNYLHWDESMRPKETSTLSADGLQAAEYEGFYVFSEQAFEKLMAEGKPVFLDIGAAWCQNCKANMKKVLSQPDIQQAFRDKGVTLFYGDFTKEDPILKQWLEKEGSVGVPFNALYIPGEKPIKMSELFSKKELLDALDQIKLEAN